MYFQSPGVISIDFFIVPAMKSNPKFGELGVTDLDQTYFSETRLKDVVTYHKCVRRTIGIASGRTATGRPKK